MNKRVFKCGLDYVFIHMVTHLENIKEVDYGVIWS